MAFKTVRANFTASAGPVTVAISPAMSTATYYAVAGMNNFSVAAVKYRIHNKTTTSVDVTLDSAQTGSVDLFLFE